MDINLGQIPRRVVPRHHSNAAEQLVVKVVGKVANPLEPDFLQGVRIQIEHETNHRGEIHPVQYCHWVLQFVSVNDELERFQTVASEAQDFHEEQRLETGVVPFNFQIPDGAPHSLEGSDDSFLNLGESLTTNTPVQKIICVEIRKTPKVRHQIKQGVKSLKSIRGVGYVEGRYVGKV